jgi:hypothetical protein
MPAFLLPLASESQHTLRIQLPGATEEENHLAATLARVPWEMARAAADPPALGERNLLVRVVHDMDEPDTLPLALGHECLRVQTASYSEIAGGARCGAGLCLEPYRRRHFLSSRGVQ